MEHPRPQLAATSDDAGTEFGRCWARLARQWLLPTDPLATIDGLTVYDLRVAALELFSAGCVNHSAIVDRFRELLRDEVPHADGGSRDASRSGGCSGMT